MQINSIKSKVKSKHLSFAERGQIEAFVKLSLENKEIASRIGVCSKTIQRELKSCSIELCNSDSTTRVEYAAECGLIRGIKTISELKNGV